MTQSNCPKCFSNCVQTQTKFVHEQCRSGDSKLLKSNNESQIQLKHFSWKFIKMVSALMSKSMCEGLSVISWWWCSPADTFFCSFIMIAGFCSSQHKSTVNNPPWTAWSQAIVLNLSKKAVEIGDMHSHDWHGSCCNGNGGNQSMTRISLSCCTQEVGWWSCDIMTVMMQCGC